MGLMDVANYLDLNSLLLDHFKELGIDEIDVVIILLIDRLIRQGRKVVTPEGVVKSLSISATELDKRMATLMDKELLRLEETGQNFNLSVRGTIEQLILLARKGTKYNDDQYYHFLENDLGRPLSSAEITIVNDWVEQGFTREAITEAWCQAISRKKGTIRYVDSILQRRFKDKDSDQN